VSSSRTADVAGSSVTLPLRTLAVADAARARYEPISRRGSNQESDELADALKAFLAVEQKHHDDEEWREALHKLHMALKPHSYLVEEWARRARLWKLPRRTSAAPPPCAAERPELLS
jgi:hypothetical protein